MLLIITVGFIYSGLLYFRNPLNKLSRLISIVLSVFRFLVVSFLAFLLLSPYIKTKHKQVEKPIIIIGQDNSSSIQKAKDSVFYLNDFQDQLNILKAELESKADIESYIFGEDVVDSDIVTYDDNLSDYSDFISFINQNYSGLNVGAAIIIGDGIVNNGIDPVYAASEINFPVFTMALGDTSKPKDIIIDEIRNNSIVYSGDIFPVEINISALNMNGQNTWVRLIEGNSTLSSERINVNSDDFHRTIVFNVSTSNAGKRRFRVVVDPVDDEVVSGNNVRDIFVDVLDSRLKILILATAPHPDIGAIKQSLEHNPNFTVNVEYNSLNTFEVGEYDAIVLFQIPSVSLTTNMLFDKIIEDEVPVLFITGKQSRYTAFNRYFDGLKINSTVGSMALAQFEFNNDFKKFTFDKDFASQLSELPPLTTPLANYQIIDGFETLAWQKISSVITDFPLIGYYSNPDKRSAVIMGEGIWLWRIQSLVRLGNTAAIDALLSKTIMYLTAENDKRRFKVITDGVYNSREEIIVKAELYNQALEPDNSADVSIRLINENNEEFNFVFTPYENYYLLNLNKLPVGVYSYRSAITIGNESFSDQGEFVVQLIDYESRRLIADHRMLSRLASLHDGEMYYTDEIDELKNRLVNLENLKSKVHYQDTFTGLNTMLYIMIALILLLSIEWFLRKYYGNY